MTDPPERARGAEEPGADDDAFERYHALAETVGMMPSLRRKDNIVQGVVVGVGTLIGAVIGMAATGFEDLLLGGLIGALVGLIIFALISGFVLMIVGGVRAAKRRAAKRAD